MTIRHLKTFVTVCECGTMTKAAEILYTAQPAISSTVAELEKYYGVALFDRINQRLVLTETGKNLLIKAKAVLAAFSDFENTAKHNAESPVVNIGSTLTIGKTIIPALIKSIKDTIPGIAPHVMIGKAAQIEEALLAGELDFALMEGEPLSEYLEKTVIAKDRLAVVCGKDYVIGKTVTLCELAQHPFLLRENGSASRNLLDQVMQKDTLGYSAMMISQSNEAILEAAKENLGIAVLPYSLVKDDLRKKVIKEIKIDNVSFNRNYYLVKHKSKHFGSICKKAYDFFCTESIDSKCEDIIMKYDK